MLGHASGFKPSSVATRPASKQIQNAKQSCKPSQRWSFVDLCDCFQLCLAFWICFFASFLATPDGLNLGCCFFLLLLHGFHFLAVHLSSVDCLDLCDGLQLCFAFCNYLLAKSATAKCDISMIFIVEEQHFHDRTKTRTRMDAFVSETKRWTTKAGCGSLDFVKNKNSRSAICSPGVFGAQNCWNDRIIELFGHPSFVFRSPRIWEVCVKQIRWRNPEGNVLPVFLESRRTVRQKDHGSIPNKSESPEAVHRAAPWHWLLPSSR